MSLTPLDTHMSRLPYQANIEAQHEYNCVKKILPDYFSCYSMPSFFYVHRVKKHIPGSHRNLSPVLPMKATSRLNFKSLVL